MLNAVDLKKKYAASPDIVVKECKSIPAIITHVESIERQINKMNALSAIHAAHA